MICISNFVIFSIFFNTVIIKTKNKINKYSKKIFSNFFQKCINFEIENGKKGIGGVYYLGFWQNVPYYVWGCVP